MPNQDTSTTSRVDETTRTPLDTDRPVSRVLTISELQYTQPELQLGNINVNLAEAKQNKRKSSTEDSGAPQKRKITKKAAKACNECRKQKSKCFAFNNNIGCLRCSSVGRVCSFEEEALKRDNVPPHAGIQLDGDYGAFGPSGANDLLNRPLRMPGGTVGMDSKLQTIQRDVSQILAILKTPSAKPRTEASSEPALIVGSNEETANTPVTPINNLNHVRIKGGMEVDINSMRTFGKPSSAFLTSPYMIYSSSCSENALPIPIQQLLNPVYSSVASQRDIITLKILSADQASTLLQHFRDRYGRWVSFPEKFTTEMIMKKLRARCPLLLTVACTLALKYSDPYLKKQVYQLLLHTLQIDLNACMLQIPQSLEFLQALVILSIYGLSFSSESFTIDAWYLSGCALQHFITKDSLGTLLVNRDEGVDEEFHKLTTYRVWNHLSLVHLVYCILSGRQSIIDELGFGISRKILELPRSTNFDGRMIAELSLHLVVYNFIQSGNTVREALPIVRDELRYWLEQWGYLFDQPANEFVEMGYHYGYFMVLYNWTYKNHLNKMSMGEDAAASPPSITTVLEYADSLSMRSMLYHAQKVVDAVNSVENDSYFAFLSNQIHLAALSSALMLVNLSSIIAKRSLSNTVPSLDMSSSSGIIGDIFDSGTSTSLGDDSLNKIGMSNTELSANLAKCAELSSRFRRVSTGDDDSAAKFSMAIDDVLNTCFPTYESKQY
ncbi:unnamed protein product [Kuraishia capsulata CBS 1993]|uniref:Zn(2)-C6 fungal-type domain-containing protein n=1 Tax=Kuraishia capsulata CBS 1993 TaxID=1382522 RepID=W6MM16_9ASCO|nr:uncharacterized protein KUCA_T00003519001 [Kuraishia capsulata CBS 1993]CDK27541.1 unnamed protein product [Kuraishia capsulata CBS 1993]